MTCSEHGDFEVTPNNHLKGRGCPDCGAEKRGRNGTPRSTHKPRNEPIVTHVMVSAGLDALFDWDDVNKADPSIDARTLVANIFKAMVTAK